MRRPLLANDPRSPQKSTCGSFCISRNGPQRSPRLDHQNSCGWPNPLIAGPARDVGNQGGDGRLALPCAPDRPLRRSKRAAAAPRRAAAHALRPRRHRLGPPPASAGSRWGPLLQRSWPDRARLGRHDSFPSPRRGWNPETGTRPPKIVGPTFAPAPVAPGAAGVQEGLNGPTIHIPAFPGQPAKPSSRVLLPLPGLLSATRARRRCCSPASRSRRANSYRATNPFRGRKNGTARVGSPPPLLASRVFKPEIESVSHLRTAFNRGRASSSEVPPRRAARPAVKKPFAESAPPWSRLSCPPARPTIPAPLGISRTLV